MVSYVVYSAPTVEPVTVSEVISYCRLDTSNQEPAPSALTAYIGSGAGNVDNGAHRYKVTFVTDDGETQGGIISNGVAIGDKTVNGKISLTEIPVGGSLVTSRRIYRTAAGGSQYLLLTAIADNTTTTYTDNTADSDLGAEVPSTNTTGDPLVRMLIASARAAAETILKRPLITQTIDAYYDSYKPNRDGSLGLLLPPLQSVSSITYVDESGITQTLAADQYIVDYFSKPTRITPAYGVIWPYVRLQPNAIKIRFIAGYGAAADVPACIKNWMLLRIKHTYENRDVVNIGNFQLMEFPSSLVDGLLDPEKIWGYE